MYVVDRMFYVDPKAHCKRFKLLPLPLTAANGLDPLATFLISLRHAPLDNRRDHARMVCFTDDQ